MRYGRESGTICPGDPERRDHGAADGGGGCMTDYLEFLRSKIEVAPVSGLDVNAYPV